MLKIKGCDYVGSKHPSKPAMLAKVSQGEVQRDSAI